MSVRNAGFFNFYMTQLSKGQIEDSIAKQVTKFYVKALGVGPRETRVYLVEDMIIIRLKGKLLPIEQKLLEYEQGVKLIKNIREILHEITVPGLTSIIKAVTKQNVTSSHSDISTKTGEIVQVYVLDINYEERLKETDTYGRL